MSMLVLVFTAALGSNNGLVPLDDRWQYSHYLSFRPGDEQTCDVNPPRMSWPYLPQVIPQGRTTPVANFTLQLSQSGRFDQPDLEVVTPYNFYNALPVLGEGIWSWRVGYNIGRPDEQWSIVRRFSLTADAVRWDRTLIDRVAERMASQPRPRLGPPDGDWTAWRSRLERTPQTAQWLELLLRKAELATKRPWWKTFPQTDAKGDTPYDDQQWAAIAGDLAAAAFAHRLTGDSRYLPAKDHALALARFPKGGLASPEYHGPPRKWATQITEHLALCHDWWHPDLSHQQRRVLLDSIAWRIHATYLEKNSWRNGDNIAWAGVGGFCQSHPYENFMWSLPAVLLTAGDLEISDTLVPLCLNYLSGVTVAHGPDEGWNEGLCYGSWKGETMLRASLYTALLVPELHVGRNPAYRRLGEWYSHLMPLGIDRLSFGDYAATPARALPAQQNNFRFLAWLTGEGRFAHRWRILADELGDRPSSRPWLDLLAATRLEMPAPAADGATGAVFPEAGWIMESTRSPTDRAGFAQAVGMIFQCRPRGGFSHSFRAENDFVWHAYGRTLSAGGGGTAYPDPHSRHSISHNVVLVDGVGQEWTPASPAYPFAGRLLAYRKEKDFTYWVGDATHAYQTLPGLLRCHRHVVFVAGKWFVLFDDLAVRPEAKPARFSWLFHVAPDVPLQLAPGSFEYSMGDVTARVVFAGDPQAVEIVNQSGRRGFENLITGEDMLAGAQARLEGKDRELTREQWMAHNIWVTNRRPARAWTFLSVLAAQRDGQPAATIGFPSDRAVTIAEADGPTRTISFDPNVRGDVELDVETIRMHALATDPGVLPPPEPVEEVSIDGDAYRVEWLARETFDAGMRRWVFEGNAEVGVRDGKLWVHNPHPDKRTAATLWFLPELPQNVMVRFRAQAVPPADGNAANLNLILHGRELDGSAVRFGRSGAYSLYHAIPNYIVTLTGGMQPGWSRARRNPGFHLLHEADVRSEIGRQYAVTVTYQAGRLRYYLDGTRIHDAVNAEPLPAGRFAIRSWSTNAWWDDVEFGRLVTD